jgi:hypothetical protein
MRANQLEIEIGAPVGSITIKTIDDWSSYSVSGGPFITLGVACDLWRVRALCTRRGKDTAVTAGIATLTANQQQLANARWNFGGDPLKRDEWFVKQLRVWMGYTNVQMDTFFEAAAGL